MTQLDDNLQELNRQAQAQWNQKAGFWDEMMGEDGNMFHSALVAPTAERLLAVQPGELVLDVACGNGTFARQLARLEARVVAADFSAALLERAQARNAPYADRVEYRQVDATHLEQLLTLGEKRFDAAVCNMAFMDIATLDPLLQALARLLKPIGRFVFTSMHPCFSSTQTTMLLEEQDRNGQIVEIYSLKISGYLNSRVELGAGAIGEPTAHLYFHRPLHAILNSCFKAGFVLDGMEEPAFGPEHTSKRALSWASFKDIPPVIACRLRLLTT